MPGKIDPDRGYRQWLFGVLRAGRHPRERSRLSANVGLRYEFVTTPTEVDGKISNLRNVTDRELTVGDPWHDNPSLKNFAPRLGLAWDPFGDGRTSVRAGFGIFHDEILPKYYFFSGSLNPPFTTRTSITNPPFPNVVANFDPNAYIRAQLQTVNFDLQTPYIMQFNANVQRELPGDWDVMVGYVGSRGRNLIRLGDANLAPETIVNGVKMYQPQLGRRNPDFPGRLAARHRREVVLQLAAGGREQAFVARMARAGVVHAVGIGRRFERHQLAGLQQRRAVRDGLVRPGVRSRAVGIPCQAQSDVQRDLGAADFRNSTGSAGALLKGWQLNNITTLRSGHPFTVQLGFNRSGNLNTTSFSLHERPNVVPGCDPILGGPDRYCDINCFSMPPVNTRGNAARNSLIGPGLVSVDVSLVKSFVMGGGRRLEVRLEAFNLPNRANFAVPSGRTAFTGVNADGSSIVAPTWGRITSTVTTSRQLQIGAKFVF